MLGAGEPNFDALDVNPYRSIKQRQEWEVKALLEKVQPELIGLDPGLLGKVDQATFEQKHKERVEALVSSLIYIHRHTTCCYFNNRYLELTSHLCSKCPSIHVFITAIELNKLLRINFPYREQHENCH